uniref:NADH dehydrogenase [ubiquinone] 1 alpha subcomplex subunit 13 n=1 Tax=Polytomella parva TaxID=51329 RepID=A0A7S0UW27_9CHLO|nr:Chain Z, B16.6 [Polytomella sp. Pringsheim 198.80]7ARD_Z Chain Z, B16.6 [Polytomella sp. Pringsheim 198.80]|mmetsp:Transcript_18154/g.33178  ORF Transcript_18154/g.33178 Transcript_18154/m.33178 type:complete len:143 (+) Transcript_18154:78-506(+)|eukprot:CAMPEP_0175058222 /NCGR_PEP_ID=MMETSP0052_2-20121109/11727_1 /TAXON_ID=51329 ORGANISM="Polytomella parva, Strain SAG 63-3" /NCGR_SAMPLE_ID=MMETSP0052_2 /ASSEMBLY_ACC=CAM_ASM_000194 /LENGTH=142 /DNA_ID=CAMNT_0016323577 /DNA_START=75 /DNA_END=503 /DNA_ORIENTATION=+
MTEFVNRGFPGLKSIKDLPKVQDVPPPGGFPSIRIERKLPNTGPTGLAVFLGFTAFMALAVNQARDRKSTNRLEAEEVYTARSILHPILQAEWDLRYLEHQRKEREDEAKIMKDVPGWKVGEATSRRRWLPPVESFDVRPLI